MRLDTIVIGTDFSPAATAAANWAATALAPRARLALVHAIEPPARPAFLVAETLPPEALETAARSEAMEGLCELARGFGTRVRRAEVRIGRASEVIREYAIDVGADCIVVGRHGTRSHRSLLLGTTADTLVREATVPVLIGSRTPVRGRTRVIAGVVDAPVATRVLTWAGAAAQQLGGRLTTIHAIEPAAYAHMASLAAAQSHGDPIAEELELEGERQAEALRWLNECSQLHIDPLHVDAIAHEGLAAEIILERASRERAALIVLGSHESTPPVPRRIGRTVRHVLHGARCAVLVVTPS